MHRRLPHAGRLKERGKRSVRDHSLNDPERPGQAWVGGPWGRCAAPNKASAGRRKALLSGNAWDRAHAGGLIGTITALASLGSRPEKLVVASDGCRTSTTGLVTESQQAVPEVAPIGSPSVGR